MKKWIVMVRVTALKEVYCSDCSKAQAKSDPFSYAEDEREVDREDWEVLRVEEDGG